MLNILEYTKNLEESGFEREQAEILIGIFMQLIEFNMVSKSDFEKFQTDMNSNFNKLHSMINLEMTQFQSEMTLEVAQFKSEVTSNANQLKSDIENLQSEIRYNYELLDQKINKLSLQLTVKLGVMLAFSVGLLSTILAIKL